MSTARCVGCNRRRPRNTWVPEPLAPGGGYHNWHTILGAEICLDCYFTAAPCGDCIRPTQPDEIYMVHDAIWTAARAGYGYLCIECLERRIGRQLARADFTSAPVNWQEGDRSPLLTDRLAR